MVSGASSDSVEAGGNATGATGADGARWLTVSLLAGDATSDLGAGGAAAGPIGAAGAPETSAAAPTGNLPDVVATVTGVALDDVVAAGRPWPTATLASNALRARYGSTRP